MSSKTQSHVNKWALFRFSIVGGLIAKPPAKGKLHQELTKLASQAYMHPVYNRLIVFHFSTIECWYYKAKNAQDPIIALGRKLRSNAGMFNRTNPEIIRLLGNQYKNYPHWSYQLHADNLTAEIEEQGIEHAPSYATIRRRMKERGWIKKAVSFR